MSDQRDLLHDYSQSVDRYNNNEQSFADVQPALAVALADDLSQSHEMIGAEMVAALQATGETALSDAANDAVDAVLAALELQLRAPRPLRAEELQTVFAHAQRCADRVCQGISAEEVGYVPTAWATRGMAICLRNAERLAANASRLDGPQTVELLQVRLLLRACAGFFQTVAEVAVVTYRKRLKAGGTLLGGSSHGSLFALLKRLVVESDFEPPSWFEDVALADKRASGTLLTTFDAYVAENLSVADTAERLARHPNTIYKRLEKLGNATGNSSLTFDTVADLLLHREALT